MFYEISMDMVLVQKQINPKLHSDSMQPTGAYNGMTWNPLSI